MSEDEIKRLEELKIQNNVDAENCRKAIQSYIGFDHAYKNALLNFNENVYKIMKKNGWYVPDKPEDLEKNLEEIKLMYGEFIRNGRQGNAPRVLYRGTN